MRERLVRTAILVGALVGLAFAAFLLLNVAISVN
jgi:hypothetical protein